MKGECFQFSVTSFKTDVNIYFSGQGMDEPSTSKHMLTSEKRESVDHTEKLTSFCRLCGKPSCTGQLGKAFISVQVYKKIIKDLFDYDLDDDKEEIHPPFLCPACERKLERAKIFKARKEEIYT